MTSHYRFSRCAGSAFPARVAGDACRQRACAEAGGRLLLDKLTAAYDPGHLHFFGDHAGLAKPEAFGAYLTPLRRTECVTGGWSVSTNADELRGGGATNSTEDVRT